jgi:transposase InsO family protein
VVRGRHPGLRRGRLYIPMARGFLYLVVIMDWVSRAVLAWRLSNTLGAAFCVEAFEEALSRHGRPEIFNTDQGSQFTSDDFTGTLERHAVTISMDGKVWRDDLDERAATIRMRIRRRGGAMIAKGQLSRKRVFCC